MTLTLRPDLVLVALPPISTERRIGTLIILDVIPGPAIAGIVRDIGRDVNDVSIGDKVIFSAEVGEYLELDHWPHLIMRAHDIDAIIEGTP